LQCNSEKFQLGQIEFLTENREGINATPTADYIIQNKIPAITTEHYSYYVGTE